MILGLDHVQLAMPAGEEEKARAFYIGLLGMVELEKPAALRARGGCWFLGGTAHVHLGVQRDFQPAKKAHPAFLVGELGSLLTRLREAGVDVSEEQSLPGRERAFVRDPFANRIELMQEGCGFSQRD